MVDFSMLTLLFHGPSAEQKEQGLISNQENSSTVSLENNERVLNVRISVTLFQRISDIMERSGFSSVSDYVAYVLRDNLTEKNTSLSPYTPEDEELLRGRLKSLGYLE